MIVVSFACFFFYFWIKIVLKSVLRIEVIVIYF